MNKVPAPRRLKYITWNAFAMETLLKGKHWMKVHTEIPSDLKVVGVERKTFYDATDYNEMVYLVHSKSFDQVPYGEQIPELVVFFEEKQQESK